MVVVVVVITILWSWSWKETTRWCVVDARFQYWQALVRLPVVALTDSDSVYGLDSIHTFSLIALQLI